MRTSLNDIKQIEAHLLSKMSNEDALLFEAQLLLDNQLKENLLWQQKTYALVKLYGRNKLKEELEQVHQQIFNTQPTFRTRILSFFKKS
ncbi:MAG TPA: hypothetical protein VD908_05745 [Cytophagales bacterium]|nr:hypothetical protein [Cytophagales bacterium]